MHIPILILIQLALVCALPAQLYWQNGSFEGQPQDATVPQHWLACQQGTTPDILPGYWGVYQEASEGETYLGLISREDGSWESISQRLTQPLQQGKCYSFSIDLAHSRTYSGYNQAIRLRIWGSNSRCGDQQLLFESPLVTHSAWRTYPVSFTAKRNLSYIIIEAYSPGYAARRGNILIDNLGPIRVCPRACLDAVPHLPHPYVRG